MDDISLTKYYYKTSVVILAPNQVAKAQKPKVIVLLEVTKQKINKLTQVIVKANLARLLSKESTKCMILKDLSSLFAKENYIPNNKKGTKKKNYHNLV